MTHGDYHELYDGPLFEGADSFFFDSEVNRNLEDRTSIDDIPNMVAASNLNMDTASTDNTAFQYSDSSYGYYDTSGFLWSRHIGAGFESVVSPPYEGPVETSEAVPTVSVAREAARIVKPDIRVEVYDDSLGTCQPARQHQGYLTDSSSGYIATPDPTEGTSIDTNYEHDDIQREHSTHAAYADPSQYPSQMDCDLAGLRLQASASEIARPHDGVSSPLLSGSFTMERSFPLHMYTPDGNPFGGVETRFIETSPGVYSSDHAGHPNSANSQIPSMYERLSLGLVGGMTVSRPSSTNTAGVLSNQHTHFEQPMFPTRGFSTAMFNGVSTGFDERESQPSSLCRFVTPSSQMYVY
ncbi:uncharacterized protein EKO05_0001694 [Ascochyta rabiei]|uniref:uncharacterized protein n=1 Tax=Didymella rabiei TaxID=5454 RepID=UPI0021FC4BF5|nr:uncharacterized protein EKO05_0001694 [Ascochyta rabiei]UPX11070.1 hypothetical protein EKO05_0001694 [Ascochyta rabiei]